MARTEVKAPWWDALLSRCLRLAVSCLPIATRRTRVLVRNGDSVLLVMNRFDVEGLHWALPGGGCKYRESVEDCAVRELAEEVGVRVSKTQLKKIDSYDKKLGLFKAHLEVFLVEISGRNFVKNSKELLDARWFEMNDLPENLKYYARRALVAGDKSAKL